MSIPRKLNMIIRNGFLIRLASLLLILTAGSVGFEPYFIIDDISYETLASNYIQIASSPIDLNAFRAIGASAYLTTFWSWVTCISAYLLRSQFAGRLVNVILSTISIKFIFNLTLNISRNNNTALVAAKYFAYLPLPILTSCFNIKDIFLTFSVLYIFNILVKFQKSIKISGIEILVSLILSGAIYFTRGAVVESISLFLVVLIAARYYKKKHFLKLIFWALIGTIIIYIFINQIRGSFIQKIDDYSGYALMDTTLSTIQMSSISQIYKLPFSYFFASLQPLKLNYFSFGNSKPWLIIISYLNISIYHLAIGNFLYIFSKKKNLLFWSMTFAIYSAIISLSLGIFRHYLFLFPIIILNYCLFMETHKIQKRQLIFMGSSGLFLLLLLYSLRHYL